MLPTAAGHQGPDLAVSNARRWFGEMGLNLSELRVLGRAGAQSAELAALASAAGAFYLVGGDPGLVVRTLQGSRVWAAMVEAWREGAALAGSSAGAMALCEFTLVMARWPRHSERRAAPALGLVPRTALVPHYERFGTRWDLSGVDPELVLVGLDERTAAIWDGGGWRAAGAGAVTVMAAGATSRHLAGAACEGIPAPAATP